MTNDEIRMANQVRITNDEGDCQRPPASHSSFEFRHSNSPLLALLRAVLAAAALAAIDAEGVERAADDVVAHAGQIAHAAAADQHDAVFLKVVLFAGDVGGDFLAVAEPHAGDLSQRGVRLLGGHRLDLEAHATLLWAGFEVFHLVDPTEGT